MPSAPRSSPNVEVAFCQPDVSQLISRGGGEVARGPPIQFASGEPFTGLDLIVKPRLFDEIKLLCGNFGITLLVVTHDPLESRRVMQRSGRD